MTTDTLRAAIAAKVRVAELRQKIAAEKLSLSNYEQQRAAIERRALGGRKLASPSASTSRPPAPAPQHPHLAKLDTLTGTEATAFYREHRSACIAEEADRRASIASAQLRENIRAAKSGKGFSSNV